MESIINPLLNQIREKNILENYEVIEIINNELGINLSKKEHVNLLKKTKIQQELFVKITTKFSGRCYAKWTYYFEFNSSTVKSIQHLELVQSGFFTFIIMKILSLHFNQ